jgi:glycosyltransferase involved in cell wall biosynthesis
VCDTRDQLGRLPFLDRPDRAKKRFIAEYSGTEARLVAIGNSRWSNNAFLMKILFLDQSGQLGGAELCLLDLAKFYGDRCLVALFESGPLVDRLQQQKTPVQVLQPQALQMRKDSGLWAGLRNLDRLIPLIMQVIQLARQSDVIYVNTAKALVVGAIASLISRKPLVYHLHDIISPDHFSRLNQTLLITLANWRAKRVIANSQAAKQAFVAAGGKADRVDVIYNGFDLDRYAVPRSQAQQLRLELGIDDKFVVGHFSRLSPWKGQHILLEALAQVPDSVVPNRVVAVFVGAALFGEDAYAAQLQQQVVDLGLTDRVKFLGFRSDIPALMAACDLVAHTSIVPEPFGRVIVEAMLCQTAVVATAAGGAIEIVADDRTGWLTTPGDVAALAAIILAGQADPVATAAIARCGYHQARQRFPLVQIQQQTDEVIVSLCSNRSSIQPSPQYDINV